MNVMAARALAWLAALSLAAFSPTSTAQETRRPNILVILADDLGYSDLGCYGGEIHTPHIDALARRGARFTEFYTSARCCPTRASLMTGLYPSQAGIGDFTTDQPNVARGPGYLGRLNDRCVTLAEVLKPVGYGCYYVGKWHMHEKTGPIARGFDEFYGFTRGHSHDQYDADYYIRLPAGRKKEIDPPQGEFYATDVFNAYALEFMRQGQESGKPWLLFLAHSSPHFPVQAPAERADKYDAVYRRGWDVLREERFRRMQDIGLVDGERWKLTPRAIVPVDRNDIANGFSGMPNPAWDSIDEPRRRDCARRMAVFAAMVERIDHGVGQLVDTLKATGAFDDTLILFLSDNGACYEWGPWGFDGESRRGLTTLHAGDDLRKIGGPGTHHSYGSGWANLGNTPLRLYKHFTHEGGIATPCVVHWPAGIGAPNRWIREPVHVMDVMPTLAEAAGARYPATFRGNAITPMEGQSLLPLIRGGRLLERSIGFSHEGARALRKGDWKVVWAKRMPHEIRWELYNLAQDRCETEDLAAQHADRVETMAAEWEQWARRVQVIYEAPGAGRARDASGSSPSWDTLAAGGDTMIARWEHDLAIRNGIGWPLEDVAAIFSSADAALCNLECCVALTGTPAEKGEHCPFYYRARPEMLRCLTAAGIDIVTAANNHGGDYGAASVLDTLKWTAAAGLVCVGVGKDAAEAAQPRHVLVGRTPAAIYGLDATMPHFAATAERPGSNWTPEKDLQAFTEKMRLLAAAPRAPGELLILTVHWDDNWVRDVQPTQRAMAKIAFAHGVDLILGHSAHRLKGIEVIDGKVVLYDMGNLLFDCLLKEEGRMSAVFRLRLSPRGVHRVEVLPVRALEGRTVRATAAESRAILDEMQLLCAPLGTVLKEERETAGALIGVLEVPVRGAEREGFGTASPAPAPFPRTRDISPPRSEAPLRDAVPADAVKIDPPRELAPGIELVGFRLPDRVREGRILTTTTWWRVTREVRDHWLVGIELASAGRTPRRATPWYTRHDPGDWLLPFSRIRPGEIVEDCYPARLQELPAGDYEARAMILDPALPEDRRILAPPQVLGKVSIEQAESSAEPAADPIAVIGRAGNAEDDATQLKILRDLRAASALDPQLVADLDRMIAFVERWNSEPSLYRWFDKEVRQTADYQFSIAADSPLAPLACFYRGRMLTWIVNEYGNIIGYHEERRRFLDRAVRDFRTAAAAFPENRVIRMYLGEPILPAISYSAPAGAPAWAAFQREGLERLADIVIWWIRNRLGKNGEYGGGWDDDCEMWRHWVPLMIAFEYPEVEAAQAFFSRALLSQSYMKDGYTSHVYDVEHTAEPSSDTITPMMHLAPDDTSWKQRALRIAALMRERWCGRNQRGMLQFKSTYFNAQRVDDNPVRACDTPYHTVAVLPALVLWLRTGDPELTALFSAWMDTWVDAAARNERGKPAGVVPAAIRWPAGEPAGPGPNWWDPRHHDEPKLYEWPSAVSMHMDLLLLTYHMTGQERYLAPVRSMAALRLAWLKEGSREDPEPGSARWCGSKLGFLAATLAKYKLLTGSAEFDEILSHDYASLSISENDADRKSLVDALERNVEALRVNFPGYTSEVRFTDRVLTFPRLFGADMMFAEEIPAASRRPRPELLYATATGDRGSFSVFPVNAVKWLTPPRDIAALVTRAGREDFAAELFHFGEAPRAMGAELYLLAPGEYTLILKDPAGAELAPPAAFQVTGPRTRIRFELPPRRVCVVRVSAR